MNRLMRAGQLAVAAAIVVGVIALTGSAASAGGCDNSWLNPGSGLWFNDGNWSAGHSPTEDERACIEVDGDYTVSLVGGETVASLSIGSTTTTGTQRLAIGVPSQGGSLTSAGGVINGARGEIAFNSNTHSSSIAPVNSTLVNQGAITMSTAPGLEAAIFGNLRNAANGVIHVNGSMGFYSVGGEADTLLNQGQIEVADASTLVVRRSSTFTNAPSGHISSTGTGQVASGLELDNTFNEAGTTLGPAPVRIYGGTLNYTDNGTSHIEATGQFNLTGTLHAGQSLTITDANANALGGFTNAAGGDLEIHSQGFSSSLSTATALFLNQGQITLTGAGTAGTETALFGSVTNAPGGVVRANYHTGLYSSGSAATFLNRGRVEIADGTTVIVRRSSTFTNAAIGHIEGEGTGHVRSGAELDNTFNEAGTTSGPKPVVVAGGTLNYTGDGTSDIEATGQFNLNGTLSAGQGLTIADGHANASASGFVNDGGQMRIEAFGVSSSVNVGSNTFANDGTVRTVGGSGPVEVQLFGDLTNTGTLDLEQSTGFFKGSSDPLDTLLNQGQIAIDDAKTLDLKRGTEFAQSAGRTTLDGAASRLSVFEASGVPLTGGILEGTGTVAANVTNGGEVRPGTSPGTLNVDGAYTQTPDGVLVAEVTATGNDLLDATGAASLDGTLEIETASGFTPSLGDTFKVVEGSARSGEFADVNGIGGGPYEVLYNPADVTLQTIAPSDLPAFSIDDVAVREGNSGTTNAVFRVHLSEPQSIDVTVDYRTANGSAREPGDYTSTEGTLTFAPGVVQRNLVVPVVGDDNPEPDETFQVNLRNADGAQVADGRGIGTIENDELDAVFVSPNRGGDACCITVTAHGEGFVPGATLRLERAGQPDVVATRMQVADDGRSLAGVLNLAGRQRAAWDVVVSNPAGRGTETLPGAFTVEAVRAPSLWTRIDGGGVARPDQPYTAMLAYGNTGNVDAIGVRLELDGIPSFDRVDLPTDFPPGLVEERAGQGRSTKFYISRLAPGTAYAPVQPFFEGSGDRTIRARIIGETFAPGLVPTIDPDTQVSMNVTQATDPAATSPAVLRGTYQVTGPGGGDIAFDYTLTNVSAHAEPTITLTRPAAGVLRYRLQGTVESGAQIKAYDHVLTGPEQAFAAALGAETSVAGRVRPAAWRSSAASSATGRTRSTSSMRTRRGSRR